MKSTNIVKKVQALGYETDKGKWKYWNNIDVIIRKNGTKLYIADFAKSDPGTTSLKTEFKLSEVLDALEDISNYQDMYEYREEEQRYR